jgi:ABC-2 type transport system permease protein
MEAIIRHALSRARGQILGWGIGLGLYGLWMVALYDALIGMEEQYTALLESYPPEMLAFFGGMTDLFSPAGYLNTYFYSMMPIIIGIYAVLAGSGLLAGDEESGILDLVLAHPIGRTGLFLGRVLALAVTVLGILAITWLGFIVALPGSSMQVGLAALALPLLSLFAVVALFAALALLLSMVLPSRSLAASASGLILVASYFITSLATIVDGLVAVARFSPLNYYQGGSAVDGLNWGWLGGLLGAALLLGLAAWQLFQRRDIRVGGESGWHLPSVRSLRRRTTLEQAPPS